MNKNQLKEILVRQNNYFLKDKDFIEREKLEKIKDFLEIPHIVIISGLRRVGKSSFLSLINKKYFDNLNFRYLNFEDEKLFGFKVEKFSKLYETFLELSEDKKVFFLDEIKNLDSWEIAIRRLYEEKIKFFITGSNSNLLSKELGSKLTGRYVKIELFTFSFREFLKFKKFYYSENDIYLAEKKVKILKYFDEYLNKGGMPEYLKYEEDTILKQVYDDIIYKDILVRYKITDERQFKELSKYVISNIGKEFSYNKLKNMFGFGSSNTPKAYLDYLENSYLIFQISKFDYSLKKQIINQKKIYSIDLGFVNLLGFYFTENIGRNLENLVFIELKRQGKEVFYHKKKKECDFVIFNGQKITEAIQVTYSLEEEETKKREIEGLLEAMKEYDLKEALILTYDEENEIELEGKKIKIVPVWKWMIFIKDF